MKVPSAELAVVDPAKVRDYRLSPEHPVGRFKAAFFGGIGYSRQDWQILAARLLEIVASEAAAPGGQSAFGDKYEVRGTLVGPAGRSAKLVTVWIVLSGENAPRFVTAFPGVTVMTFKELDTVVLDWHVPSTACVAGIWARRPGLRP